MGISPEEFWNTEMYVLDDIVDAFFEEYKDSWEKIRNIIYVIAQVNSTKKINPKSVMKFAWDNEKKPKELDKYALQKKEELRLEMEKELEKIRNITN